MAGFERGSYSLFKALYLILELYFTNRIFIFLFFSGIHVSDTVEGTSVDLTAWIGPMIVTLMALIVVIVCCCFLRIDPSAPHSEEIDAFR